MPFDKSIFKEEDFLWCYVSDRPSEPSEHLEENEASTSKSNDSSKKLEVNMPVTSGNQAFVSIEIIRPFPKAPPRKSIRAPRNKGKCRIATDTPEKIEHEERHAKKKPKKEKIKSVKRKIGQDEDTNEEDKIYFHDNSSEDELVFDSNEDIPNLKDVREGEYLIVKVHGKASIRNYAAKVLSKFHNGYEVNFLKRHVISNRFTLHENDQAFVPFADVLFKLPLPIIETRDISAFGLH